MKQTETQTDFTFSNHGTIFLVSCNNADALAHMQANVDDEAMWMGDSLCVEHRYAADLREALIEDGFAVD